MASDSDPGASNPQTGNALPVEPENEEQSSDHDGYHLTLRLSHPNCWMRK